MQVTVYLHTIYQMQTPQGLVRELHLEIEEGSTLDDVLDQLSIQPDPEETLFVINGKIVDFDTKMKNGDAIHLIPAISGGLLGVTRTTL